MERRSLLLAVGTPDQLGETIGGDDTVRLDRQKREHEALPRAAQVDVEAVAIRPQPAEHP